MEKIKKALAVLAVAYSKPMTREMADLYLGILIKKNEQDVLDAIERCVTELPRFPTVADICNRIKGNDPDDQEIVGLIYEAIELYGYPAPDRARAHMGEVAWRAVLSCGGWINICNTPASDDTSLRAQLRMAAQGAIRRYKEDPNGFTARLPNNAQSKLTSLAGALLEHGQQDDVNN